MKTPRLCLAVALLSFCTFIFAQQGPAPICDVTCAPDPGGSGYDTTVAEMTKPQNMRGTKTVYAPEIAGSRVAYHATGNGQNSTQSKIIAGSSSYSYAIPILSLPGRNGLDLNLTLYYNSAIWTEDDDNYYMTFNADRDFPSYGFRLGFGFIERDATHNQYTLVENDNSKRQLSPSSSLYVSTDSSFIQYDATAKVLTYKDGTRVFYAPFPNQTTLWRPTKIEDTNGNYISISYRSDSWAQGQEISAITDTLGRQIVFTYDANTHELAGIAQGSQQYVTFSWNNGYVLKYNFSGFVVQNSPANNSTLKVLTKVTYAGNSAGYSFSYGDWGIVKKMQFGPSGGTVARNYVTYNYPPGTTAQGGAPQFSQQTVFDGVNTYNWQYSDSGKAITDPYGTTTTTATNPGTGLPQSITVASGSTTLRTTTYTWNSGTNPTVASVTTTLGDSGQQSQVAFSYDAYKNTTEAREYDYGLIYTRRTHIDYLADTNHVNVHILNRPTNVYVYDEVGGEVLKKRTDFVYDEYAPASYGTNPTHWDTGIGSYRGNATTNKRYETPSVPSGEIDRHFHYDVAGNLILADVDCCTSKAWTFDSSTQFAYPTTVTTGSLVVQMGYDFASGLLTSYIDENSQPTQYSYDAMFRLTNVQRPDLQNYGTSYNDTQALELVTNTSPVDNGITVTGITQLDGAGRVIKQTTEDNDLAVVSIVDTAYDGLGRRTSVSNPYVSESPVYTQFLYDALSRVSKVIPPDGTSAANNTQYSYSGNTTTITDPAGKQRRNYGDALGRLVRVDEPGGAPASASVTITGSEASTLLCDDEIPPRCFTIYDSGSVTLTVNGLAKSVGYTRTSTPTALASGLAGAFNSDANSPVTAGSSGARITLTSVLSGASINYGFSVSSQADDPDDFPIPSFSGSPTSGSLTGGSDNGGPGSLTRPFATFYSYDAMDNLTKVTQGAQQRTYVYGGLGHLLSARNPESGLVNYYYQNSGIPCSTDIQKICQRSAPGSYGMSAVVTTYSYDTPLNRLTGVSYSDSTPPVTFTYDSGGAPAFALGRLTSMTDGTGFETYTYDQLGRISTVAKVMGGTTYNLGYTYDYIGDLTSLTYPDNSVVNQSYDAAGRLAQISSAGTNYLTVPAGSYNSASLPTILSYGSGVQATIGYNTRLQLASLDYAQGSTDLLNLTYNYNQTVGGNTVNNGQIQGITDTRGNAFSTSYTYDALGRLKQGQTLDLTAANTWKLGWVYDRYGNRSQQNLLGGTISTTAPQLTIGATSNRITSSGFQYAAAGNLTADAINTYSYDAENRVTAVNGGSTASYAYDGIGLRVQKVVGASTTVYIFSGSEVIAEYVNGALSVKYVYAGSQLLATVGSGTTYHYPDHLSARFETNDSGTVTRTFGHLPFGETWYETGTASKWKFTSYERDAESGLDYAMFRYDSSRLGRFMTADPLAGGIGNPQSLNRYGYVLNDPVNGIDPDGRDCLYLNDAGDAAAEIDAGNCESGDGGYYIPGTIMISTLNIDADSGLVSAWSLGWDGNTEFSVAGAMGSNDWGAWTQTFPTVSLTSVSLDMLRGNSGPFPTATIGPAPPQGNPQKAQNKPGCWGKGAVAGLKAAAKDVGPGTPGSVPTGDITSKPSQAIIVGTLIQAANAAKTAAPFLDSAADAVPIVGDIWLTYQGGSAITAGYKAMDESIKQCNGG